MRTGPHPLNVHISMAASEMARQAYDTNQSKVEEDFSLMLTGIQRYQNYPDQISRPILRALHHVDHASIWGLDDLEYTGQDIVLCVPSLVNKAYIFNLTHARSFLRHIAERGYYPILLQWGDDLAEKTALTIEDLLCGSLASLFAYIRSTYDVLPHVIGYCMGGTMLLPVLARYPDICQSATFLASPWDFHAGERALQKRIEFWRAPALQMLESKEILDKDWLQTVFASMAPLATRDKFIKFSQEDNADNIALFIAIEDWLNDGVDLPKHIAKTCIDDWYMNNLPVQKSWIFDGHALDVSNISTPCLVVASDKDRLVECVSSKALLSQLRNAVHVNPQCGHIGMIAGSAAQEKVWNPILDFIASCNSK